MKDTKVSVHFLNTKFHFIIVSVILLLQLSLFILGIQSNHLGIRDFLKWKIVSLLILIPCIAFTAFYFINMLLFLCSSKQKNRFFLKNYEIFFKFIEEERNYLSKQLNDQVLQHIAAFYMYPEVHKSDYLMTSMNNLTESLRSLSISLYPIHLDREGFKSSIIDYIQIFNTNKLAVTLDIDEGHISMLDKNPKYILFAAVQNIISRLLKETHIHFIQITSMTRRGKCILSVSDDSDRPFSEEESDKCKDLEILIDFLERELFMFDGSLQVSHVKGKGRIFLLSIPII